jgi:hypothetical protein
MKRVTRLAIMLVAVLFVGAVAFALANPALAPRASQIPTVVTTTIQTSSTSVGVNATPTPLPAAAATPTAPLPTSVPTAVPAAKPTKASASGADDREVVKPKVRDDGDGDENGSGPSDHDSDNDGSSTGKTNMATSGTALEAAPSGAPSTGSHVTTTLGSAAVLEAPAAGNAEQGEQPAGRSGSQRPAGGSADTHQTSSGKKNGGTSH